MSKRWNRKDLDLDRALEEGLCRSTRPARDDAQAREKFKLLLRICRTALDETLARIGPRFERMRVATPLAAFRS